MKINGVSMLEKIVKFNDAAFIDGRAYKLEFHNKNALKELMDQNNLKFNYPLDDIIDDIIENGLYGIFHHYHTDCEYAVFVIMSHEIGYRIEPECDENYDMLKVAIPAEMINNDWIMIKELKEVEHYED